MRRNEDRTRDRVRKDDHTHDRARLFLPTKPENETASMAALFQGAVFRVAAMRVVFSYSSLQLVPTGAYAPDLRSLYADGSHQTYSDAKFGVSCNSGKFEHIVLVAAAAAR